MIYFNEIKWCNFLSTGNAFTTLQLDKHPTTLIVGENGSGKSTLLDAMCFVLFGKAYRNINKPQLVNTINNKQCVVEITFTIGNKLYKVVRGIKPTIFEIWVNGILINQDAASKDYQKYLEESILKLNYKSFTQLVILGSASFTPFMQLTPAARREVIEDILDIKIFTAMNQVLKNRTSELKEKMVELDAKITIAKNKAQVQQEYIKTLQDDRNARIADIESQIQNTIHEIYEKQSCIDGIHVQRTARVDEIQDLSQVTQDIEHIVRELNEYEYASSKIEKDILFYHKNDNCPKCRQGIPHDFKTQIVAEQETELTKIKKAKEQIKKKELSLQQRLDEIKRINADINMLSEKISELKNDITSSQRFIQRLELEKNDIVIKVGNIEHEKNKLKDLAKETVDIVKERADLNETQHYYDIAAVLLKDSGIKTRVIRKYLPVINKLVNKYLAQMDFFVQFTLDEKFDEIIKSRYRDDFSYESFSEGEKQRIDLALLFTWRTIAKLKNSASTNLLILDEIFDSSLDNAATELVMTLLNTIGEGTHVMVISHKGDTFFDKFTNVIRFQKKKNFSVIG
jgi:DNA repair exonuclease SbcCD ATPase subunit